MAKSNKQSETKVTRITASEGSSAPAAQKNKPATSKKKIEKKIATEQATKNPFVRIGRYFKGAWQELRQVRWPDRKNTWAMTGALLAFTTFFIVVILFLDFLFSELFKLIMGSN